MSDQEGELIQLTQRLLNSIASCDWETYIELCDDSLTAFEPEAMGRLVHGMPFHRFYFDLGPSPGARHTTICDPHIRLMGDVGLIAYTRVGQSCGEDGVPTSSTCQETRVWQKIGGKWKHVHFHRS